MTLTDKIMQAITGQPGAIVTAKELHEIIVAAIDATSIAISVDEVQDVLGGIMRKLDTN